MPAAADETPNPTADLFAAGLERHLALASALGERDGDAPTPACPGWTVRDVYAHLAGAATDVLDGRVDGAGSDAWTARQVEERRGRTLGDNVAELAARGPALVEALRAFPIERLAIDQWAHEQDVRGALGCPGSRDVPLVTWALPQAMGLVGGKRRKAGKAAIDIVGDSGRWRAGDGDPVATVRATDFDLLRGFLGRRSPAQMHAWIESGGGAEVLDGFAVFGPRPDDLIE